MAYGAPVRLSHSTENAIALYIAPTVLASATVAHDADWTIPLETP